MPVGIITLLLPLSDSFQYATCDRIATGSTIGRQHRTLGLFKSFRRNSRPDVAQRRSVFYHVVDGKKKKKKRGDDAQSVRPESFHSPR
ncbi:hypothetical protein GGR58DRAFT_298524 [Xylaria digitata]|nr:hypothetical protein GGR58DRAFT_298524 [Xylaria digitata]